MESSTIYQLKMNVQI